MGLTIETSTFTNQIIIKLSEFTIFYFLSRSREGMYTRRKSLSPIKGVTEPALKELLKNLEKNQIQTLRKAIESRGEHQTSCIIHSTDTKFLFLVYIFKMKKN